LKYTVPAFIGATPNLPDGIISNRKKHEEVARILCWIDRIKQDVDPPEIENRENNVIATTERQTVMIFSVVTAAASCGLRYKNGV
jgi:hypothetical protein